jgi:penicillin-binding protein 2
MVYDPPGSRKRRRRSNFGSGGDTFLTRRMFIAKGGILAVFSGLAARLGYLQLVQGEEYKTQAEDNVIREEILPAPRGIIYDRVGRPLAENRRTWEVRVTRADLPDDAVEQRRVLDMLISALQLEDVVVIRPRGVPSGSRETIFQRVADLLEYSDEKAQIEFERWNREWGDRLVLVAPVSLDDAARFRSFSAELPGVLVMNEIDFLVGNIWADELPITVKTNVPRSVALTLEANSMYMPGVSVDDSGLSRLYPGGEVMSHLLGYVRMIDGVSLDDLRNRDESNQRIYDQNDTIGKEGLEQALETELRGRKGRRSVEVDANGVVMRTLPGTEIPPVEGRSVNLTIDLELQETVGNALRKGIEAAAEGKRKANDKRRAEGKREWKIPNSGAAVVYDPRNGEVLAMVSYPYYDNQLFVTGISARKWDEYTASNQGNALINRAIAELYPPGSTYKIFLAASALQQGTLKPSDTFYCSGAIRVPTEGNLADGLTMACWIGWLEGNHGTLDLYTAIAQSCDTYFYNVAVSKTTMQFSNEDVYYFDWNLLAGGVVTDNRHVFVGLGIDPLADDMQNKFWFGKATGIEILGEAAGLFPDREWKQETFDGEGWSVGDTLNVSIGQGEVKLTPLQLTMNVAAFATGGIIRQPHLVHSWINPSGAVEEVEPVEISNVGVDKEHLDVIVEGMRGVVHDPETGTAHHSIVDGEQVTKWPLINPEDEEEVIEIAGKTGTAEFGETDDIGARDSHAWFTCFAPLESPEVAVSVVIEAGGEGSTYAVPVVDEILRAWMELTGKRPRGLVLDRSPNPPIPGQEPSPEASPAASPEATPNATLVPGDEDDEIEG